MVEEEKAQTGKDEVMISPAATMTKLWPQQSFYLHTLVQFNCSIVQVTEDGNQ